MRVVYISGSGRSGSTLLGRILGGVPGVCDLGEAAWLWECLRDGSTCSCGAVHTECEFWTAVGDKAFGGWASVDLKRAAGLHNVVPRYRHLPSLAARHVSRTRQALLDEYVDQYARIYSAAAAVAGADVLVDTSKAPPTWAALRRAADFDLRIVHLVRDPRGVAYSWTKVTPCPHLNGQFLPQQSPTGTALTWNLQNAATDVLAWAGPRRVPVLRVRYEDLLAEPRRTVKKVARFAGLDLPPTALDYVDSSGVHLSAAHSVGGNPKLFVKPGRLALRLDDTWRSALPTRQRLAVTSLCFPLLLRYGYDLTARSQGSTPTV
jgi:hypothetical protein